MCIWCFFVKFIIIITIIGSLLVGFFFIEFPAKKKNSSTNRCHKSDIVSSLDFSFETRKFFVHYLFIFFCLKMLKDNYSTIIFAIFIIFFLLSDYQLYEIIQNESNMNVSSVQFFLHLLLLLLL